MPAPLSEANRKAAHRRAADEFGVKQGDLYLEADGALWGPVACGAHRLHPDRANRRWLRDGVHIATWEEPDVHQTGQEVPVADGRGMPDDVAEQGYPGYQPDCELCADQVYDTYDHVEAVRRDVMRSA